MDLDQVEVLLVEDNDEDAELTLRALRKHKLTNRLHRVADGAQALDFLFGRGAHAGRTPAQRPRVILLDLKLPKVDGMEVLRAVKSGSSERVPHKSGQAPPPWKSRKAPPGGTSAGSTESRLYGMRIPETSEKSSCSVASGRSGVVIV